jgi:lipid-A-disaccharide synthase
LVNNRELAVVGLFEVLRHTRVIAEALRKIRRYLNEIRPDLVILIDFPDFNFLIMRMAKRLSIPVFYYISPQVWAWRRGRVRTLKRLVDDMAVILPFEVEFYRRHGMKAHYVGHPLLDVVRGAPSPAEARKRYRRDDGRPLVGLLPGSRRSEIGALLPVLMDTAMLIAERRPDVEFILPLAPTVDPKGVGDLVRKGSVPVRRITGDTYGVIRACDFILTASGTVTLEAAILGTPMIITYRVSNLTYHAGRHLIKIDRAGLPNLIAGRMIAPELIQEDARAERLAEEALRFLDDPSLLERQRVDLAGIRGLLGEPGVAERTARLVLSRLERSCTGGGGLTELEGYPRSGGIGGGAARPTCGGNIVDEVRQAGPLPVPARREAFPAWFMGVYGLVWGMLWPAAFVVYTLRSRIDGKYGGSYLQRLGLLPPPGKGKGTPPIWIHALSVGETLSVAPLVRALKESSPEVDIVFSSATETGQKLARANLSPWVHSFFYLPHDLPLVTEHWVRRIQPRLFVLVETDLWPNLLSSLKRHGIRTALVNGRLSERSFRRMLTLRGFWRPLLNSFEAIFAQSFADRTQYILLGADSDRVHVLGNLKFDAVPEKLSTRETAALKDSMGLSEGRLVWIAGSTHEGEEEILLRVHVELTARYGDLLLIVAPRRPGRAPHLMSLCERMGLGFSLRSTGESVRDKAVFILDTLGELGRFYAVADVAFIGGGWVPFGGHNPLEAAAQGKPACWGPHLFNFREVESALLEMGCFQVVRTEEELRGFLETNLAAPDLRGEASRRAGGFLKVHRGAAGRLVRQLARDGEIGGAHSLTH